MAIEQEAPAARAAAVAQQPAAPGVFHHHLRAVAHHDAGSGQAQQQRHVGRATEIETFQRQSIIVPNSELINAPLGNWTHRNKVQRSEVPVSVAYDTDPQEVIDLLLEVVTERSDVLRNPEPHVEFLRFGASSLDFELRFHLADFGDGLRVRNEVRIEILRRFRARDIVMPFAHQEVMLHIQDRDRDALLRRGSRAADIPSDGQEELFPAPDDDKLLP